jgi:hypothetical protein
LPPLHLPAITFLSINSHRFIFLFGGRHGKKIKSDLIAIDIDNLLWWVVPVEGGSVSPRMDAAMVAIGTRIHIFNGLRQFDPDEVYYAMDSFSIIDYDPKTCQWRWLVCDQIYPPDLPDMGSSTCAVPVYDGKQILLIAGRKQDDGVCRK